MNSALEIAQILSVNDGISHLNLRKNQLCDEGVKVLIKAAAKSRSIVHLDLSSNSLTHIGAKKVFKSLLKNQSIISLRLGSIDSV